VSFISNCWAFFHSSELWYSNRRPPVQPTCGHVVTPAALAGELIVPLPDTEGNSPVVGSQGSEKLHWARSRADSQKKPSFMCVCVCVSVRKDCYSLQLSQWLPLSTMPEPQLCALPCVQLKMDRSPRRLGEVGCFSPFRAESARWGSSRSGDRCP
jgi:hypothetical protein